MDLPQVTNIRQFTNRDVEELLTIIHKDVDAPIGKYNAFDLVLADHHTDEHFQDQDTVIGDVTIDGVDYKFIHSFPGDEPCGVVYKADLSFFVDLHWSMDRGCDPISDWYLKSVNQYHSQSDHDDEDDSNSEYEMKIPETWFV